MTKENSRRKSQGSRDKKSTLRMCVGCRQMKERSQLVRVRRLPGGKPEADRTGKGQGRGAYVCTDSACIETAFKRHAFERALKCHMAPEDIRALTEEIRKIAAGQGADDDGAGTEGRENSKRQLSG